MSGFVTVYDRLPDPAVACSCGHSMAENRRLLWYLQGTVNDDDMKSHPASLMSLQALCKLISRAPSATNTECFSIKTSLRVTSETPTISKIIFDVNTFC